MAIHDPQRVEQDVAPISASPLETMLLERASLALIVVGAITMMAGISIFVWQCYAWLKFGVWTPIEVLWIWYGQQVPSTGWFGVDKIIRELVTMPLSFSVFLVGLGLLWAGVAVCQHWSLDKKAGPQG